MGNMMKLSKPNISNRPRGATSLLIVVGISLVFIVIISGLTALSIRESRQALSTDLSNRALAAAESYVKQTAQDITRNPQLAADENCEDEKLSPIVLSSDADNETEITCKTVTSSGSSIEREVYKDKTSLVYGIKGDYTMKFSWGNRETCTSPIGANRISPVLDDSIGLDQIEARYRACLSPNLPAVLELMFFSWNDASLNAINGITPKTVLILPTRNIKDVNTNTPPTFVNSLTGSDNTCKDQVQTTGYQCNFELNLSQYLGTNQDSNVAVLVRPRYTDTNYLAEFKRVNIPQSVQSNTASIDVTARVGDYYRRVTGQVKLDNIQNTNAISDVLYSYESICKRMTVGEQFNQIRSNNCN